MSADRENVMAIVAEAVVDGARQHRACEIVGLDVRTYQRWALLGPGEDGRMGPKTEPANKLSVLERECDSSEFDDERIGFLLRVGALQRDRLQDLDGAVEAFRQVLKADEMHRVALVALAELHDVREEHEALFKVLTTLSDIAENGGKRCELLRRLAKIAEANLGRKEMALALWDEVSRLSPDDEVALRELEGLTP